MPFFEVAVMCSASASSGRVMLRLKEPYEHSRTSLVCSSFVSSFFSPEMVSTPSFTSSFTASGATPGSSTFMA